MELLRNIKYKDMFEIYVVSRFSTDLVVPYNASLLI